MTLAVSMPAGHEIVAADLDAYEALTSVWPSYTPTWTTSGTQPVIGNGVIDGRYMRSGLYATVALRVIFGSTSTYGTGEFRFSLPTGHTIAFGGPDAAGSAVILDSGTTRYAGSSYGANSVSYVTVVVGATNNITATTPITFTTSDAIYLMIAYQT